MRIASLSLATFALGSLIACTPGGGAGNGSASTNDVGNGPGTGGNNVVGGNSAPGSGGVRILANDHGNVCGNDLAATTFRFAICVCEDAAFAARVETSAFSSSDPNADTAAGGLGANGDISAAGDLDIGGSLAAGGNLTPVGSVDVENDLIAGGNITFVGSANVGGDAFVGGNLTAIGLDVGGNVHANDDARLIGVGPDGVVREPVSVDPPCGCGDDSRTDVVGIVEAARADNDNAANAIDQDGFRGFAGDVELTLPAGRFYFSGMEAAGAVQITVSGPTAIFVDGDIALAGVLEVIVDGDDASLDLFIAGDLAAAGALDIGSRTAPSKVRVYVGGTGDIAIAGDADLGASLFAPDARVALAGSFTFDGALVAGSIAQAGELVVRYDADILDGAGGECDDTPVDPVDPVDPEGGNGGNGGDGGDGGGDDGNGDDGDNGDDGAGGDGGDVPVDEPQEPATCDTPADCGNQACVEGVCGACASDLDCAAPLQCAEGVCIAPLG